MRDRKIDHSKINVVKVISATLMEQRLHLGEKITEWLAAHPSYEILDIVMTQSSDSAFHCLACIIFAHDPVAAARKIEGRG